MIEIAYTAYLLLSGIGIVVMFCRLVRGPAAGDRLNSADLISITCVGLIVAQGAMNREAAAIDIALVAALVLFFGTTLVATLWADQGGDSD
ncbi:MAG: multisubunit Na+/H+ antiporter MnhF subunit [Rhodothermales bacterium]|jgi:multisubunit Na+/H+ antiporter MnhF subunit